MSDQREPGVVESVIPRVDLADRAQSGNIFEIPAWRELFVGDPQAETLNLAMALSVTTRSCNYYYVTGEDPEEVLDLPSQQALVELLESIHLAGTVLAGGQDSPPFAFGVLYGRLLQAYQTGNNAISHEEFLGDIEAALRVTQGAAEGNPLSMHHKSGILAFVQGVRTTTEQMVRERLNDAIEADTWPTERLGINERVLCAFVNPQYWNGNKNSYWSSPQRDDPQLAVWALKTADWIQNGHDQWPEEAPELVQASKTDVMSLAVDPLTLSLRFPK
jgi:hypothetical protein